MFRLSIWQCCYFLALLHQIYALPLASQLVLDAQEFLVSRGELSKWASKAKKDFLKAASDDKAHDWIVVLGNEAGDTDSMVSSLSWAWQLSHSPKPQKAVALLQTAYDAIDLRPENALALEHSNMAPLHGDMLSVDELPVKTWDLHHRIKGLVLVDHNLVKSDFGNTTVLSIFDHHEDRNASLQASPRVVKMVGSCSSLVTLEIKKQREEAGKDEKISPFSDELADLLLHTISIDTKGAKKKKVSKEDHEAIEFLWPHSSYKKDDIKHRMKKLSQHMFDAQADLKALSVRDFLRRDYKGGPIQTKAEMYPKITVGYANVPVSLNELVAKTPEGTSEEFFAIARTWTSETGQDVSVILTEYKDEKGEKAREIAILVARGWAGRMNTRGADSLFNHLKNEFEKSPDFNLKVWIRPDGKPLLPRRAVWRYIDGSGRKTIRPFVERAVQLWEGPSGSE